MIQHLSKAKETLSDAIEKIEAAAKKQEDFIFYREDKSDDDFTKDI